VDRLTECVLIIRVLRGHVDVDCVDYFHDRVQAALSAACPDRGCAWAQIGRQVHSDHSEDIVMVTAWESMDALYDWIGGRDLLSTPFNHGDRGLLENFDVQHYETLDAPAETA
jgi:hypothetical protein